MVVDVASLLLLLASLLLPMLVCCRVNCDDRLFPDLERVDAWYAC